MVAESPQVTENEVLFKAVTWKSPSSTGGGPPVRHHGETNSREPHLLLIVVDCNFVEVYRPAAVKDRGIEGRTETIARCFSYSVGNDKPSVRERCQIVSAGAASIPDRQLLNRVAVWIVDLEFVGRHKSDVAVGEDCRSVNTRNTA